MESIQQERSQALSTWLQQMCVLQPEQLQALPGDASFRRYFRIPKDNVHFIVMDAPPPENCRPFVAIAKALAVMGLHTPDIIQADLDQGFLLLSDFGDTTYLKALTPASADVLYKIALDALAVLQACQTVAGHTLPYFDAKFMQQEWVWHKQWVMQSWQQITLPTDFEKQLDACVETLNQSIAAQPQVFMHRDYHAGNLMVLPHQQVGILDFQDAFIGPVTYDLASLLRDCYIAWPKEKVQDWVLYYLQQLQNRGQLQTVSASQFLFWFDEMSVQRHLKALLTFARKAMRDHQPAYLKHLPLTLSYLQQTTSRYPHLQSIHDYLSLIKEEK